MHKGLLRASLVFGVLQVLIVGCDHKGTTSIPTSTIPLPKGPAPSAMTSTPEATVSGAGKSSDVGKDGLASPGKDEKANQVSPKN